MSGRPASCDACGSGLDVEPVAAGFQCRECFEARHSERADFSDSGLYGSKRPNVSSSYVPGVPDPVPAPVAKGADEAPWTWWLLAEFRAGEAEPDPVAMPDLPLHTPALARAIYEDMALRWGLRFAACDDRPLPYATTEAIRAGFCKHPRQASRAINWLEREGLIWSPGSMPRRNKPDGTRLFLPGPKPEGPLPNEACRVEAATSVRWTVRVEHPHMEVVDEAAVSDAPCRGSGGFGTVSGGTEPRFGHTPDFIPEGSREHPCRTLADLTDDQLLEAAGPGATVEHVDEGD